VPRWKLVRIAKGDGSGTPGIDAVSCPDAHLCLASDAAGAIHWSRRPAGDAATWHRVTVGGGRLIALSCPSAHLCVASGGRDHVFATADPTGPRSAWHAVKLATGRPGVGSIGARNLTDVACAPHHLCLAATGIGAVFAGNVSG
jgi:hypothetical protein